MDDLTNLMYKGNQLLNVSDRASVTVGFIDANNSGIDDDFEYDANGNMILDRNKGISSIAYNHLNLPIEVVFDNNQNKKITYIYDAAGSKHEKQVNDLGNITNTVYAGNYIYENTGSGDALKFFSHPEGYAEPNGFGFDYVYQYKDHLGNIRLSYKDISTNYTPNLQIVEENNYYPFGMRHKGYNNVVTSTNIALKRKFGGKEYNEELGLEWYDISARNYDPALGRWMNIDPLAEQMRRHSPYNFAFDNPIFWTDPDGMSPAATLMNGGSISANDIENSAFGNQSFGIGGSNTEGGRGLDSGTDPKKKKKKKKPEKKIDPNSTDGTETIGGYKLKTNDLEKNWLKNNPVKAKIIKKTAAEAGVMATVASLSLGGDEGGYGDAIRHAYWMFLIARELGPEIAKMYGNLHENFTPTDGENAFKNNTLSPTGRMDLHNNNWGIKYAILRGNASPQKFRHDFNTAVMNGKINIIDKTTIPRSATTKGRMLRNKRIGRSQKAMTKYRRFGEF